MSLLLSFFVPLIKIVSLSALNEMFLAVFFYPKLPCETGTGRNVVLAWGAVLGWSLCAHWGARQGRSAAFAAGDCLCWLLLCLLIHFKHRNTLQEHGEEKFCLSPQRRIHALLF